MTNGFRYKVLQTGQGPEVEVSNFRWKTSVYSAMWSAAWAFATTFLFSSLGRYGAFAFFGGVFCGLMALLGTRVLILSLVKRQLSQSATELRLQSSFLGVPLARRFRLDEIISFGFGYPSHSGVGVLKLSIRDESKPNRRNKWIILADHVKKEQIDEFLKRVKACGFILPQ